MFQGYNNYSEEQGFPWQQQEQDQEHGHHGPHSGGPRHHGHHGPRGEWGGEQFEGPWGRGRGFEGPRGFGRGPWGRGFGGPRGRGFGGFGGPRGFGRPDFTPEQQVLRSTAGEVMRLFAIAARSSFGNQERQGQLRSFLERARTELLGIIGNAQETPAAPKEEQQPEQPNVEQA